MINEKKIIEKLQNIEALYAGATTEGEKNAAAKAIERIKDKLKKIQKIDPAVEYRFTFSDMWSRKLFIALLRRYDINPYRYYRQKHTTVMAHVSPRFVKETLWPEYKELNKILVSYLDDVTNRVISKGIYSDSTDIEIKNELIK